MSHTMPRIVFMGTPEFAVASLKALVENGYNVVGVVTMPDKPSGRGYKLQPSPVKQYAMDKGLTVLQPEKLKSEDFLSRLKALRADLQVVVAFRMLPEVVWSIPPKGTFNLHSSLLPQYRGAAPINWAIINGEKETGVSTFFLSSEIDTGEIIFQERTAITDQDNAGSLHDRLMEMGAKLVLRTVDAVAEGNIRPIPQEELVFKSAELKPAPKIFTQDCKINWNKSAEEVHDFVRGLSPYPAAWTLLPANNEREELRFKIFSGEPVVEETCGLVPGTIVTDHKKHLDIAVSDGFYRINEIQLTGKKKMDAGSFLNGFKFKTNDYFLG